VKGGGVLPKIGTMDDEYFDDICERCCSDPQGDHTVPGLNDSLTVPQESRRCHSLSQLKLLETAVIEMEDRCVQCSARASVVVIYALHAASMAVVPMGGPRAEQFLCRVDTLFNYTPVLLPNV